MTKAQQRRVLVDFINSVRDGMLEKLHNVPENWDGIEIRQWVADTFAAQGTASVSYTNHYPLLVHQRRKDYNNTISTTNL